MSDSHDLTIEMVDVTAEMTAKLESFKKGERFLLDTLSTIFELVQGDDPDQALELITGSYEGEDRDLLIKIFKLEETWKRLEGLTE